MTLLIFGRTGQVACELQRQTAGRETLFLGRDQADLSDPAACAAAIHAANPGAIINAAAYTAVDKAEEEEAIARAVNGAAPGAMAKAAAELGVPFIHISTDYVFDGSGDQPFREDAPTGPLGAYGRTKLLGEQAVADAGGTHAILRTAWVFSAHGNNFVKTMLRLSETREALSIVADQFGGPTPAGDIASACLTMADQLVTGQGQSGIYHFAGEPHTNWAGFAREIFAQAGRKTTVTDIPASDFPTPAARPGNSRLDCRKIAQVFGVKAPDWKTGLAAVLAELKEA